MHDFSRQPMMRLDVGSQLENLVIEPNVRVTWDDPLLRVENTITCHGNAWFEGSITARRLLVIPQQVREDVYLIINGNVIIEDDFHVKGSVEIQGTLEVRGDVIVFGDLRAHSLKVKGKCHVNGSLYSSSLEITDNLQVGLQVTGSNSFVVNGAVSSSTIQGYASVVIDGRLRCESLSRCQVVELHDDAKIERITDCKQITSHGRLDVDVIENVSELDLDDSLTVEEIQKITTVTVRSSMAVKKRFLHSKTVTISGFLRVDGNVSQIETLLVNEGIRAEVIDAIKKITCNGMLKVKELSDVQKIITRGHLHAENVNNVGWLEVTGRVVAGSIHECQRIDASRSILVDNDVQAKVIVTSGNLDVGSIHGCENLLISGEATIRSPCDVKRARIGKSLSCAGGVIQTLEVSGMLINEGALRADSIHVGSLFKSIGTVTVQNDLVVNGKARLDAPLMAKSIRIGSILDCQVVEAESVFVGKQVMIHGGLAADEFVLGKEGRTMGPVVARKAHIHRSSIIDYLHAEQAITERNVKARCLVMKTGDLHPHVEISEELIHEDDLTGLEHVTCSQPPKKVEILPKPPNFSTHLA